MYMPQWLMDVHPNISLDRETTPVPIIGLLLQEFPFPEI